MAAVARHADAAGLTTPTSWLMNQLGLYLNTRCQFQEAERLYRRALAIDEASYGPDHPDVAAVLNNLAGLLNATEPSGRGRAALPAGHGDQRDVLRPRPPDVARDLNNLAALLQDTNRLTEAEPLYRRAWRSRGVVRTRPSRSRQPPQQSGGVAPGHQPADRGRATLSGRHWRSTSVVRPRPSRVATDLSSLANLLRATSRLTEAEPLFRRALAIDEASYGPDHADVARDLNNLAGLLKAPTGWPRPSRSTGGRWRSAKRRYGPDHPEVATSLNNLAWLLQDANRLTEAEPLSRRALEIFLQITHATGHEHPHLLAATNNYAGLLAKMGSPGSDPRGLTDRTAVRHVAQRFGDQERGVSHAFRPLYELLPARQYRPACHRARRTHRRRLPPVQRRGALAVSSTSTISTAWRTGGTRSSTA